MVPLTVQVGRSPVAVNVCAVVRPVTVALAAPAKPEDFTCWVVWLAGGYLATSLPSATVFL